MTARQAARSASEADTAEAQLEHKRWILEQQAAREEHIQKLEMRRREDATARLNADYYKKETDKLRAKTEAIFAMAEELWVRSGSPEGVNWADPKGPYLREARGALSRNPGRLSLLDMDN